MHYLEYNEKKQHGTEDFPIEFYHVDEQHPRYNMPFHWHKELEMIRILEGRLILSLDEEKITAKAGDVIFINEGIIHGGFPENCIYECIVFDMKLLLMHTDACRRYLRQISHRHIAVKNHFSKENRTFLRIAGHLFQSMQKKAPGSELITVGTLYEIFGIIFENHHYTEISNPSDRTLRKTTVMKHVLEYIDQNYSSLITLQDLSKIAGMSPKYFCRYFHVVTRKTPMDYVNYYRIERSCYLLSTTDLSVTEAAFQCGFNDSSYFVKTFRKYKGITPKQYLKTSSTTLDR